MNSKLQKIYYAILDVGIILLVGIVVLGIIIFASGFT